ncbi:pyridoxamine 5'-phosphate oxidase [Alcaligenes faecalis]|uniref:Pyridoxine/pyridoxamine 5'-phosphate oxidase n=1 Tax=Alcaligenes faecalis TaxID=511 RepID=A0ABY7N0T4_ALCFA|nr:pyridoxamine 5'-phosphate oxidase [Alcaligenes faecalis]WBM37717.1 pyridoxamine 5'-phosphate oxidase [Alcaligenes faecalis]
MAQSAGGAPTTFFRLGVPKMIQVTHDVSEAFNDETNTVVGNDPIVLFGEWLELAHRSEVNDANAMALATSDASGMPNVRMVLLKKFDQEGLVFYSNTQSQKGGELLSNMQAAGVLHWKSLHRQIRFRGQVQQVSDAEADAHFASRDRASRIGAWASQQSRPLLKRGDLAKAVAVQAARFGISEVPRPSYWTGFRIVPLSMEFWIDKPFRLHDRLVFKRSSIEMPWASSRMYP